MKPQAPPRAKIFSRGIVPSTRAWHKISVPETFLSLRGEVLNPLGLGSLDQVKAFQGELVKNHRGRRDILRIRTKDVEGRPLVLYLKRNWRPYKKDGLTSLLKRGRLWSISRQEWENSRALLNAGITIARPVAFGEETGLLWEKFSFLLTEAATGGQTLAGFLKNCRDPAARRRVFEELATEIRRFHYAGFATPDLFTRHLFVDAAATPPRFCWIDMARLDRQQPVSKKLRARDLAALNITAPLRFVSARERLRFLRLYAGSVDRDLFHAIKQRTEYLLRRKKFQDFLAGHATARG
jgi:heptose I phosphotransferase